MDTTGNKIRLQRQMKNYSQQYMAFMLEISQPAYSKIERDETELSLRRVYEIAEILEIDPFKLMPPSKYGLGINYLKIKQFFFRLGKYVSRKSKQKRVEAESLNIVHSDKSNN
ncbi:helix-turn-helix transcriptional regulator [Mucilaginibacter rubeus]|uniref:Helix-turn-helix transcriptional regulator n=1 Tax=Mucilaginibacter rubeus TaxID=2027860 RepID=A0AAE6JKW2_9SPHI|nr:MULTISPECIES: helix-turn-helix transcriptional regulator [Mucilaginibacter]QEM07213.1 helix-turn-helix transcriptional regulator [Mucilaginibacter rubeus]QEM19669.1 helix-turn-helix transcriptional regulator [Mucilaginibacter gossypii]QTE43635.1 helix-turn-helix transcriptional regulator [Mucilaginibacter rubeus]QTE50235.1 helix-turn-helix transcriptional regulator [Mucilaginibacter rubeus]QTE55323.1 helix-turn-helix transcriptional regulator [Mucilaginibacter rubeus]